MKRKFLPTGLGALILLGLSAVAGLLLDQRWHWRRDAGLWLAQHGWTWAAKPVAIEAKPDPGRYETLKHEAEAWRVAHKAKYDACRSDKDREALVTETRAYLEGLLPEMMHCWLGTPWDFNGTAVTPGEGKIACGYFVATVLRDAGFRVDRVKLAQESSQNILMTFLPRSDLKIEAGTPYAKYAQRLREAEPGIRIIGLDHHVSFAVTHGGSFRFVHSSGLYPWRVVDQAEADAASLERSDYRVQGLLTGNREVLLKWLKGETFPVKQTPPAKKKAEA